MCLCLMLHIKWGERDLKFITHSSSNSWVSVPYCNTCNFVPRRQSHVLTAIILSPHSGDSRVWWGVWAHFLSHSFSRCFKQRAVLMGKEKKTATQNGEKYCETESLLTLWMSPPPPLRRNRASCMQGQLERAITDNHILRRSMTPLSLAQFMQKMFFFFFF